MEASFSGQSMTASFYPNQQSSRQGKAAITIFVQPEAKAAIRAALADGGYGTSYQEGIVNLLHDSTLIGYRQTAASAKVRPGGGGGGAQGALARKHS